MKHILVLEGFDKTDKHVKTDYRVSTLVEGTEHLGGENGECYRDWGEIS